MSLRRFSSFVLVAIVLFAALAATGCTKSVADPKLLIGKWSVSKYRDTSGNMVRPEAAGFSRGQITMRYIDDARLSGDSGASTFGAGYSAYKDGSMTIASVTSAKAVTLDSDVLGQEQDLFDDLAKVHSYSVTSNSLVLMGSNGEHLVRFTRN